MAKAKSTTPARGGRLAPPLRMLTEAEMAARPVADHTTALHALDIIEDAQINLAGSAFLLDQCVTHGEHFDGQERAICHVTRLLVADVAELDVAIAKARAMILNPAARKGGAS